MEKLICGGECCGLKVSTPDIKTWRIQGLQDKDCYSIGKYATCHGVATSVRAWKKNYPNLNETTMRGFKKRKKQLKEASRNNVSTKKKLANQIHGPSTLLGQKFNTLVQKFIKATMNCSREYGNSTSNC